MTIYSNTAIHDAVGSYRQHHWRIWRVTLPYTMLLVALGLTSAVAAIADPQSFADIFSMQ